MASREEFAQLKKTVQELRKGQLDILIRLEVGLGIEHVVVVCIVVQRHSDLAVCKR